MKIYSVHEDWKGIQKGLKMRIGTDRYILVKLLVFLKTLGIQA